MCLKRIKKVGIGKGVLKEKEGIVLDRDSRSGDQCSTSGFRGCASKHQPTTTSGLVVIKYAGTCKGV